MSSEPQARRTRHIALLKPLVEAGDAAGHALQLFDTMLWVFRGTTQSNWNISSAAEADIVVLHRAEVAERMDEWRSKGKMIVVLSDVPSTTTLGDHMLVYPFPAATVLALLERLDQQLDDNLAASKANGLSAGGTLQIANAAHELIDAIRTVRAARNPELWMAALDGGAPLLWLRGDGGVYHASSEVRAAIRCGALRVTSFAMRNVSSPPSGMSGAPGDEVAWFTAYHGFGKLASWLSETARYRLCRWPDFGVLRAPDPLTMACQLRVAAALDAQPATAAALAVRARVTRVQTARTLNALSVCGCIELDASASATIGRTEFTPARPEGSFRQLLRGLRKHLHLRSPS